MKNLFHLTQVPFVYALVTKIQDGGTDITVNSIELVIPCKNLKIKLAFPSEKFPVGKLDYLFNFAVIPGDFPVERLIKACSIYIPTRISGISW